MELDRAIKHLLRDRPVGKFFLLGCLAFAVFWLSNGLTISFILMGPPIYIAYLLKKNIFPGLAPSNPWIKDFAFLLPITLVYFTLIGFQLGQLMKERGIIKTVSILALFGFLAYIHYTVWVNLSGYYAVS